jgi:pilus assembly protein CpaC
VAVRLLVGRSALIDVPTPITRVSLTIPEVADAMVTSPQQLLVHGKTPGTISLFVWDRAGSVRTFDVVVQRDLSALEAQLKQLFPGEPVSVSGNGKDIVLAGTVTSRYVVDKAAEVARGYVENKDHVVNLLRQQDNLSTVQVLLRVRFAEVSRSSLQELGVSLFSDGYENYLGRSTTQQFPAPFFDQRVPLVGDNLVFSDYLNLFLFDASNQLGLVIKALQTKGLFQSLAEPNLIAQNGKEATFLAGGEYPYPAVQGGSNGLAITVVFKEFGIRLSFTPTVLRDDIIHLKVRPEVSALDFTNAVSVQGFRVPSLSSRRAETELELRDGQTFAIAGLLNNTLTESLQKVPGIGDIPLLGLLFKSRAMQKADTELVVMITPQIMRPGSPGVASELP